MINGLNKRLHASRKKNNLSRKQVAELIGVSDSALGLYESGYRNPSLTTLVKLAAVYKVTTDYLLGCEASPSDTLSLSGLSPEQKKVLTLTAKCFRENQ